jgi:hypothetical protein
LFTYLFRLFKYRIYSIHLIYLFIYNLCNSFILFIVNSFLISVYLKNIHFKYLSYLLILFTYRIYSYTYYMYDIYSLIASDIFWYQLFPHRQPYSFITTQIFKHYNRGSKRKANPATAMTGPDSSRRLRLPDGKVVFQPYAPGRLLRHNAAGRIKSMASSGIEPASFSLVVRCLNQLRHRML